jgi:hypothetical protein
VAYLTVASGAKLFSLDMLDGLGPDGGVSYVNFSLPVLPMRIIFMLVLQSGVLHHTHATLVQVAVL